MRILIVKFGALGDVIRTSYFAAALKKRWGDELELSWITAGNAVPLLEFNPHIDRIVSAFDQLGPVYFDIVYSLDDEAEIVQQVSCLSCGKTIGAILENEVVAYTADAALWFDMGLQSRHGKAAADAMKRANLLSHTDIFRQIFDVSVVVPAFYGSLAMEMQAQGIYPGNVFRVGINAFAGARWPSKELRADELEDLVRKIRLDPRSVEIVLLGAGSDRQRNLELSEKIGDPGVRVANTDESVLQLAATIKSMDLVISSDSLAMHCAIAQRIPVVAFFSPTSAAEIDIFGRGVKVISAMADYCSYKPDADNTSITADRLYEAFRHLTLPAGMVEAERA